MEETPLYVELIFDCIHSALDLLQLLHRSSTPNPISKMISVVWDFKKWMEPFLEALKGHSEYLAFRFTRDALEEI